MQLPPRTLCCVLIWLFCSLLPSLKAVEYFVSPTGNDSNNGRSLAAPWRSIGRAVRSTANAVTAGDIITVKAGTYSGSVTIGKSGTAAAPITLRAAEGESVVVSGALISIAPGISQSLLRMAGVHHFIVEGLEFTSLSTSTPGALPIGVWIDKACQGVQLRKVRVNNIHHTSPNQFDFPNAHGILVSGNSATAISGLMLDGCEVAFLTLGSSEAVAINGNVDGFTIKNCSVHDVNNIGIDIIGYEGRAPVGAIDRARNGVVSGNTVYNVDSSTNIAYDFNPATPGLHYRAAGGIYVDGGTNCVIEGNNVYNCNYGIELASERQASELSQPGLCDFIAVRSNLVHHNHNSGLIMGGFTSDRGTTRDCDIHHNTFYKNGTIDAFDGQIVLQYNVTNNRFHHNIIVTNTTGRAVTNDYGILGAGNFFDYNAYQGAGTTLRFTATNSLGITGSYTSLASWRTRIGSEARSLVANPGFLTASPIVSTPADQYRLTVTSPLVDAGDPTFVGSVNEKDYFQGHRVVEAAVDIGMHERDDSLAVKFEQTITVEPPAPLTYQGLPLMVDLNMLASSGLPITFTVDSGPAVAVGNNLKITGPGTVELTFIQPGNGVFNSAKATLSFQVQGSSLANTGAWLQNMGQADGRYYQAAMARTSSTAELPARSTRMVFSQQWTKPEASDFETDILPPTMATQPTETVVKLYTGTTYSLEGIIYNGWSGPFMNPQLATNYGGTVFKQLASCHAIRYRLRSNNHPVMMLFWNGEVRFRGIPPRGTTQLPWGHRVDFGSPRVGQNTNIQRLEFHPLRGYIVQHFLGGQTTLRLEAFTGLARLYATIDTVGPLTEATHPLAIINGRIPSTTSQVLYQYSSPYLTNAPFSNFMNGQATYGASEVPTFATQPQFRIDRNVTTVTTTGSSLTNQWNFRVHYLHDELPVTPLSILTASPWAEPHRPLADTLTPFKIFGNVATFKANPQAFATSYQIQVGTTVKSYRGQQDAISFPLSTSATPRLVRIRQAIPGPTTVVWSEWVNVGTLIAMGLGETALLTPVEAATTPTTAVSFTWAAVPGASKYKILYRRKGSKTSTSTTTVNAFYTPLKPLLAASDYEWWITPLNGTKTGLTAKGTFRTP